MEPSSSPNQPGSEQLIFNTIVFPDQRQGPVRRVHVPLMFQEPATWSSIERTCQPFHFPALHAGCSGRDHTWCLSRNFRPFHQRLASISLHCAHRPESAGYSTPSRRAFFHDSSFLIRAIHVRPFFSLQTLVSLTFSGFLFFSCSSFQTTITSVSSKETSRSTHG